MSNDTYSHLIGFLDQHGAHYRLIDHPPEGRTEVVSPMRGNRISQAAKCIVIMVKIGKKEKKFVLGVVPGDAKVDLDAVKSLFDGTYVSFASSEIAEKLSRCVIGTVLPFSFTPDLELIVDPSLLENEEIFFNAARLDRSMALKTSDYCRLAQPRLEPIVQQSRTSVLVQKKEKPIDDLYRLRHSLAHVLAQAVLKLWPETKLSIGPPIDTGCYYDFLFRKPISDGDFGRIEKEMRAIIAQGQTFEVETLSIDDARKFWKDKDQPFKVELISDLEKAGETAVTNYTNIDPDGNEAFVDLCKGGHVKNLNEIPSDGFKLMSLAGAYWRGNEAREQLTRIYVAAFPSKRELDAYMTNLEEAAKVDHRKLGKELRIFVISEKVGTGLPMLAPNGAIIRQELENWIRGELKKRGYSFAYTPHIGKTDLYKTSGHLSHFKNDIFPLLEAEDATYVLKPMNCPHHVEIFKSEPHSYRDLPVRLAEFGTVYRYEQSGEVGGLTRVRGFTQDDAHHFLRLDQMEEEITGILDLAFHMYRDTLGFTDFALRLSLHDPGNTEKYIGSEENWKLAEDALRSALRKLNLDFVEAVGEAAFYGPKIDLIIRDAFGREWQLGTIPQVDYNMPERFDLTYTDADGTRKRPVMMHRAMIGSFERFIGVLIEHFKGIFPLWLAPVQIALIPVASSHEVYAAHIATELKMHEVRAVTFDSSDSLGKRIREGETRKIPYLLVMGDKEAAADAVTVRNIKTKAQVSVPFAEFIAKTEADIAERKLKPSIG